MAASDLNKGLCKIAPCSQTLSALTAANVNTKKDQFVSFCVLLELVDGINLGYAGHFTPSQRQSFLLHIIHIKSWSLSETVHTYSQGIPD